MSHRSYSLGSGRFSCGEIRWIKLNGVPRPALQEVTPSSKKGSIFAETFTNTGIKTNEDYSVASGTRVKKSKRVQIGWLVGPMRGYRLVLGGRQQGLAAAAVLLEPGLRLQASYLNSLVLAVTSLI